MLQQEFLVEKEATGLIYPKHFLLETALIGLHLLELLKDQVVPFVLVVEFWEVVALCWPDFAPML